MAAYRLTSPVGVILTSGPTLITPTDTDAWATYQAWLDAGNVPDAEAALPTQSITKDKTSLTADGSDTLTVSSIVNPSNVSITVPAGADQSYATGATVTAGSMTFKTDVPGTYDFLFTSDGYQNFTFSIVAS